MWHVHFVYVAFSTVLKLVAVVIPGMVVASSFKDLIHTLEGFSYITLRICLSCMLFSNLCGDISLSLLSTYGWAVVMSLVPMVFGVVTSIILRKLLPKERQVLLVLGSTFQNGLEVPLSVVSNIKGIKWLDDAGIRICQQYVFVYNLTCAIGLWSIGSTMIKFYKDKHLQEIQDAMEERQFRQGNLEVMRTVSEIFTSNEPNQAVTSHTREAEDIHGKRDGKSNECEIEEREKMPALSASINNMQPIPSVFRARYRENLAPIDTTDERLLSTGENAESSFLHTSAGETLVRLRSNDGSPESEGGTLYETPVGDPARALQQNLEWYRPSRRRARPISMKKFKKKLEFSSSATTPLDAEERKDSSRAARSRAKSSSPSVMRRNRSAGLAQTSVPQRETSLLLPYGFSTALFHHSSSGSSSPQANVPLPSWDVDYPVSHPSLSKRLGDGDKEKQISTERNDAACNGIITVRHVSFSDIPPWKDTSEGIQVQQSFGFGSGITFRAENLLPPGQSDSTISYSLAKYPEIGNVVPKEVLSGHEGKKHDADEEGRNKVLSESLSLWDEKVRGTPGYSGNDGPCFMEFLEHSCDGISPRMDNIVIATTQLSSTTDLEMHLRDRPLKDRFCHAWSHIKFVLQTPPIILSIIGIIVALFPPLRWFSRTFFGASIVEAVRLVGKGCVPLQLLTLGLTISPANLRTDPDLGLRPDPNEILEKEDDQSKSELSRAPADDRLSFSFIYSLPYRLFRFARKGWISIPADVRLSILCLSLRLLLLPAWSLLLVHYLVQTGVMPSDKLFVFSICIGVSSPSAVNASLVCTMHRYYHRPFAKMIFFMYCAAAITYTFWISVSITYANHMD